MNQTKRLYRIAFLLALLTIFYNIGEGLISTYFGLEDESLALFGFGIDSFIEVVSGIGIAHMVIRIQNNPESQRNQFERTALRITGVAFYLLFAGLILAGIFNIVTGHKPIATTWGIVISIISIVIMYFIVYWKRSIGRQLGSAPILADANCTLVCLYMSVILLISSGIYELFGFAYIDSIGALGLSYFAFNEGKECFEKARNDNHCDC